MSESFEKVFGDVFSAGRAQEVRPGFKAFREAGELRFRDALRKRGGVNVSPIDDDSDGTPD